MDDRSPDRTEHARTIAEDPVGGLPLVWAEALSDGVLLSRAGRIVWASERAAELTGRTEASALVGCSVDEVLADVGSGLPDPCAATSVECAVAGLEDDRRIAVRCVAAPESVADPALEKAQLWVLSDRSDRRRSEREVFALSRELHDRNRKHAELEARFDREVEARHQLLSVVSHELRTPLTVISGYGKLMLDGDVGPLNEEQCRFLSEIRKSCSRLDAFVAKLLGATGSELRSDELALADDALAPAIEGVVSFLRPLFDENGVHVELDLEPALPLARFDRMRIEQVLTNLLGNAAKYASQAGRKGQIDVSARSLAGAGLRYVEVAVSDDGPGLDASDRQRVFEPYVRTSPRGLTTGLGLGLAICRRIVEGHGGIIDVAVSERGGCRFYFTLPVVDQDTAVLRASA